MVRAAQYLLISIVLTFPSASVAQSKKQILTRLQTSLTAEKYFKPLDSGLPNVIFYCVCGPYETCDAQSQEISRQLGYERPSYDFVRGAAKA